MDEIMQKDIQTLKERRTRRNSSLGNHFAKASPALVRNPFGKASLCAFLKNLSTKLKKASLTVEATMVLPLFFLTMVTMISFMDLYKLQTEHLSKLCQNAKDAGMYAYAVSGGTEEITLPDVYSYKPVAGIIPLPAKWNYNSVKVHAWTGASWEETSDPNESPEKMVYVTASGTVYHKSLDCSHLKLSVSRISGSEVSSKKNDSGEKYYACESCSKGQKPGSYVYITKSGNRFHNDRTCSGLKRTVRLVKESKAANLSVCKRCG